MYTVTFLPSPAHPRNARWSCSGALLAPPLPSQPAPCPRHRQTSLGVFGSSLCSQPTAGQVTLPGCPARAVRCCSPRAGRVAPSRAGFPAPGHAVSPSPPRGRAPHCGACRPHSHPASQGCAWKPHRSRLPPAPAQLKLPWRLQQDTLIPLWQLIIH